MPRACPECKWRPHFTSSSDVAIETQEGRRKGARHSFQRLRCKKAMKSRRLQWPRRPTTLLRRTQCHRPTKKKSETSADIPCKAKPKKRGFGNNDPCLHDDLQAGTPLISQMATAETPATGGKDSYPTTASTLHKAMPHALKRLRESKVPSKPGPQDHSRTAAQATVRFAVDLEEEEEEEAR